MPVCGSCHTAICDLYPKELDFYPKRETILTYPSYGTEDNQECWICIKHAQFLQEYYPEIHQLWLKDQLVVIFQAGYTYMEQEVHLNNDRGHLEEPLPTGSRGVRNMDVHQLFLTRNHSGAKGEGCLIELRFYKDEEIPETKPYALDLARGGIDIDRIQGWLSNCKSHHSACGSYSDALWYPTRLLDLGEHGSTVGLIISEDVKLAGPYMTLSHRWGNYDYEKLTSISLDRFKHCIDLQHLPRVFQSAIDITRSLGVRYLWIDSLCIMQDKACGDWKIEALKMGQVYANTYLNLSASYAVENGENPPIFSPETWNCVLPSVLDLQNTKELRRNIFIDGYLWSDEVSESPLMGRGWVFQERFLSPRILHFGMRQLAWECNEGSALEMFPNGLPPGFEDSFKRNVCVPIMQSMQITNSRDYSVRWHEVVNSYSSCDLTFQSDKLVAFAGIAKLIESRRDDTYIAGMWKSELREDLAWWLSKDQDRNTSNSDTTQRAPSWSWLSLDGQICFYPPPTAHHKPEYLSRVLRTPTRHTAGSSELIARGVVELEGIVLPVTSLEWLNDNVRFFHIDSLRFETANGPESTHFDYDGTRADIESLCRQQHLSMVPLYATGRLLVGILVSQLFSNPLWRRVGATCVQFANILPKSDGPYLEGWVSVPETDWRLQVDGYSLYTRVSEGVKGGKLQRIAIT